MSTENAEGTVENTKTAEELQESLRKAEAKIVELKKSTATPKEEPQEEAPKAETVGFDEEAFEKKYEEKKFFEANPDMLEYKDKLAEYTSKGIWFKEAKLLVENSDETIANRKVASQTNFTSWDVPQAQATYTRADLENMTQSEYNNAKALQEQGKVTITN